MYPLVDNGLFQGVRYICRSTGSCDKNAASTNSHEEELQMKKWRCVICDYIHEGPEPPDVCPECGAGPESFEEV